jgi:3-hydroxybutyryl-CoA dehydrogenase
MSDTTITQIAVIGAGQMGAGITQTAASSGLNILLADYHRDAAENGKKKIAESLARSVGKGKITSSEADLVLSRIKINESLSQLRDCSFVVEAIIERVEAKIELFQQLDQILPPHAILASNTSSISITRLAASTSRPDRCIGMHFMNPVPIMALVEVIRGLQTSEETYQTTLHLAKILGKTTVLGIDSAGFIVNRVLMPMINEAIFLLQEGVEPADIDTAMKLGTNQPMGPLTLADFIGLDTVLFILQVLQRDLGEDKYRPCPLLVRYVEAGFLGKKSGRGFYRY